MKKIYLVVFVLLSTYVLGQKKNEKKVEEQPTQVTSNQEVTRKVSNDEPTYRAMLQNALKYNDVSTAIVACHYLLALNPQSMGIKDTLVMLYFESRSFLQVIMLTGEILQTDAENTKMLELQAISQQNLGLIKEALGSYEKLHSKTKALSHLYQIATLQYALKRYGECEASIVEILKDPKSEQEKVGVIVGNQGRQEVILKAAALNMAGVVYMEQNQDDKAKKFFEEAQKVDKDFILPKGNLEFLANKTNQNKTNQNKK
jgi:tetratricopeptide (TPR) repeat protein